MVGSQVINPWRHVHETKTLSKILSILSQEFDRTSGPSFTQLQWEFAKVIQRGIVDHVTSFPKSPRTPSDHAVAERIEDQKVDIHS